MGAKARNDGNGQSCHGLLAWREYEIKLGSGNAVTLEFSLADGKHRTVARMKRAYEALHLGLLTIIGDLDSEEEAVLWLHQATALTLVAQEGDIMISGEVREILPRYFAVFFDEIRQIAPDLAHIALVAAKTGDRSLH